MGEINKERDDVYFSWSSGLFAFWGPLLPIDVPVEIKGWGTQRGCKGWENRYHKSIYLC